MRTNRGAGSLLRTAGSLVKILATGRRRTFVSLGMIKTAKISWSDTWYGSVLFGHCTVITWDEWNGKVIRQLGPIRK